jgi:hypothetical protein
LKYYDIKSLCLYNDYKQRDSTDNVLSK